MKDIIFDLDGTIIDSKAEIVNTYQLVFNSISPSKEIDFKTMNYGAPLITILKEVYNNHEIEFQAKKLFSSIYDCSNYENTVIYPGVIKTLEELKNNNFNLYIATNKRYNPTLRILEIKKLSKYFTDIYAIDRFPEQILSKSEMVKNIIEKHQIRNGYMVGDTIGDIQAGKDNNLTSLAATYGYEDIQKLKSVEPDDYINNFEMILKVINFEAI